MSWVELDHDFVVIYESAVFSHCCIVYVDVDVDVNVDVNVFKHTNSNHERQ